MNKNSYNIHALLACALSCLPITTSLTALTGKFISDVNGYYRPQPKGMATSHTPTKAQEILNSFTDDATTLRNAVTHGQAQPYCAAVERIVTDTEAMPGGETEGTIWSQVSPEQQIVTQAICSGEGIKGSPNYWKAKSAKSNLTTQANKFNNDQKNILKAARTPGSTRKAACLKLRGLTGAATFFKPGDPDSLIAQLGCAACKTTLEQNGDVNLCNTMCGEGSCKSRGPISTAAAAQMSRRR